MAGDDGRGGRHRRAAAAGTTLLVTAAILGGLWAAWLGGEPEQDLQPAVRPVAVATIPVGPIEGRPVFGEGRLWVPAGGDVLGVDPGSREVVRTIEQVTAPVAVGEGSVWAIGRGGVPRLVRIDPGDGAVRQVIPIPADEVLGLDVEDQPVAVAAYQGDILVLLDGTVVARVDPEAERIGWEWWDTKQAGPILEMTSDGDALWMRHAEAVSGRVPRGRSVFEVPGTQVPDPEPEASEEPTLEAGCPPPDLEPTWLPPGVSPTTPRPGLGGGAGGTQPLPSAIHYGDSPGPDGGPAPFINILTWTADNHEVGPPHIWPMDARRFGTPIDVLEEGGFLVEIEDGWGAIFSDGDPPCNGYEVTAYGISRADLRRFLEGLVQAGP